MRSSCGSFNSSINSYTPLDKIAAISQTTVWSAFSWMKLFRLKFHWSFFLRVQLTISENWFRKWLGIEQAASHYLSRCLPDSLTHICGTWGRWVKVTRRTHYNTTHFSPKLNSHQNMISLWKGSTFHITGRLRRKFIGEESVGKRSKFVLCFLLVRFRLFQTSWFSDDMK